MANPTMTLIASNTVGSGGASSVTFSSIPATYTDLQLVCSSRVDGSNGTIVWKFNTDTTASNYTEKYLGGNGSTASSGGSNNPWYSHSNDSTTTTSTFENTSVYIPNYTSGNQKSVSVDTVSENNSTTAYAQFFAGIWTGTSAINAITLTPYSGNFVQYSTFYLYGISNS